MWLHFLNSQCHWQQASILYDEPLLQKHTKQNRKASFLINSIRDPAVAERQQSRWREQREKQMAQKGGRCEGSMAALKCLWQGDREISLNCVQNHESNESTEAKGSIMENTGNTQPQSLRRSPVSNTRVNFHELSSSCICLWQRNNNNKPLHVLVQVKVSMTVWLCSYQWLLLY